VDGYAPDSWVAAFAAIAGSSAALTGLLFVALSINLDRVIKGPGLIARAVEVLLLLVGVLVIATLLLMPGQGVGGASIEILVIAILMSGLLGYIHIRAPRRALGVTTANFILRVVGDHLGPLFLIIGAVTLLIGNGGGLYWVVPALIAAMVAAIIGAWVMLVEIVR
jgi:modulator of FtsH protease